MSSDTSSSIKSILSNISESLDFSSKSNESLNSEISESNSNSDIKDQPNNLKLLEKLKSSIYKPQLNKKELIDVYSNLLSKQDVKYYLNTQEMLNNHNFSNTTLDDINIDNLYPHLDDSDLNIKIANKKEFRDHTYNLEIDKDIERQSNNLCNQDFQLAPHQNFVKNYLSFNTPYNSLLLYHGLGTGKTCSAIGIAEEMRLYLKYINKSKRIIIVASPNVQENFRLQLFDERKLKFENGNWNLNNCIGNKILNEISNDINSLSKEKIIKLINNIINNYYLFIGYIEFANLIIKSSNIESYIKSGKTITKQQEKILIKNKLKNVFDNRLIIIDEIHNIRITEQSKNKLVAKELLKLVENVDTLKLLFLSATPMYNDYKEIIYLINIMNINDKRSTIDIKDIFQSDGSFYKDSYGNEVGKDLFIRKINGYISYVKGDNPLTFPYRIMPLLFTKNTIKNITYPSHQINGKEIQTSIKHLDIYINNISEYQNKIYDFILNVNNEKFIKEKFKINIEDIDNFGYTYLQKPLEALNICYPYNDIDNVIESKNYEFDIKQLIGKSGLSRIMTHEKTSNPPSRYNFEFKKNITENIFDYNNIGKYSCKIKTILDSIKNSNGPIIIYSQFIDGGLVPMALALESFGFRRYGDNKSLFKTHQTEELDINTYKNKNDAIKETGKFKGAKYIMITGDEYLSPKRYMQKDINACTNIDNINGEQVKVILLSMAGSEGLDFKFIRQIHILEPWYNLNRIEQIIGRGVRTCSHKDLPLKERNTMIFMHSTLLKSNTESVDFFVYRKAEEKAIKIGRVSRVLKENSVDCILNSKQQNFTSEILNKIININLSNNSKIDYRIGDQSYSPICDYMESCYYLCKNSSKIDINDDTDIDKTTLTTNHLLTNNKKIISIIQNMFKEKYYYFTEEIIKHLSIHKNFTIEQIYNGLTELINNKNNIILDKYNTQGYIVNIDNIYIFQPIKLSQTNDSFFNKTANYNNYIDKLIYNIPNKFNYNLDKQQLSEKVKDDLQKKYDIDDIDDINDTDDTDDDEDEDLDIDNIIDDLKEDKEDKEDKKDKSEYLIYEKLTQIKIEKAKKSIKELEDKYNFITSEIYNKITTKKDTNIYTYTQDIYNFLKKFIEKNILDITVFEYLIEHQQNDILGIFLYIYHTYNNQNLNKFESIILEYFQKKIYTINGLSFIFIPDKNEVYIYIYDSKINSLRKAEYQDIEDLNKEKNNYITVDKLNKYVGFIDYIEKLDTFEFKLINITQKRNTGSRCDQSTKSDVLKSINDIINLSDSSKKFINFTDSEYNYMQRNLLCILQEFILRLLTNNMIDNKIWFMNYQESQIFNLKKFNK